MIDLVVTILLWLVVAALALALMRRSAPLFWGSTRAGAMDFLRLLPRILVGVLGSGFIAAALPQDVIGQWLGPSSGPFGIVLAMIAGAVTPGGPVVGFSLGAAALKSGAGAPQVIAYSTAWALFALQRVFIYELPTMPRHVVWLRVVASLPVPLLAALGAMLIGKP
jgi:hypothetical protein